MYYKQFYKELQEEEEIEKSIKEEGFDPIKFHDQAGFVYSPHQHPETKLLAFLSGSMKVNVGEESLSCQKGDKLIIPGNTPHSAVVGSHGCIFFWSEKIV